jgi:hypothetical protein
VLAGHLSKPGDLAPDRGLVHPELDQALKAAVEVPHDPEADHVLDELVAPRLDDGINPRPDKRGNAPIHRLYVGLPSLLGNSLALRRFHRIGTKVRSHTRSIASGTRLIAGYRLHLLSLG